MYYTESFARSLELLRLAVPLMSRQAAAANPISYAVWYEHVAGNNAALSRELERLGHEGARLDDRATLALFRRHVVDADTDRTGQVNDGLREVMRELDHRVTASRASAEQYAAALAAWSERLADPGNADPLAEQVNAILGDTRAVQRTLAGFGEALQESEREVARLREELGATRELARKDALSGLLNRRGFDEAVSRQCCADPATAGTARAGTLVLFDIDHFKRVNDQYGHVVGDRVIRGVAQVVQAQVGEGALAARYGGEEFAVLLPQTDAGAAAAIAESVRGAVARARIRRIDRDEPIAQVTVSAGIAVIRADDTAASFVDRADRALYASKQAGRNCVTVG